jgi:hypothetical protein
MTRTTAIAALVARKGRALGAQDYIALAQRQARRDLSHGHSGARAIRRAVILMSELTDQKDARP